LCAAGVVLHHCPATALPGCNLRIQTSSGPEADVCLWWSSPSRTATRNGAREAAFPGDITFLEGMDREIKVQGSLARDDQPVGLNVEVADQPGAWIVDRSADIFPAGTNWRSAQLGLSLHMVARCDIYALRADPTRFVEETEAFIDWLKERLGDDAERGPLQVMYGIDGRQKLDELTLDHLQGYEHSGPVRIGNAAYQQLQLDIYGEMMDAIYLANKYGDSISNAGWRDVQRILEWLGKNWQRPDRGIWEVRGDAREFLHSRLMCWVAFDRALRLAQKRSLSGPFDAWLRTRDAIREDIFANFWNDDLQSFVQSKGAGTWMRRSCLCHSCGSLARSI